MIAFLTSVLGGATFRAIWGEISSWLQKRQEHAQEIERMKLQEVLDAARHTRDMENIRLQAEMGVKAITVKADADIGQAEAEAWASMVDATGKSTGIAWVDAWNGSIRPLIASLAVAAIIIELSHNGWTLTDWDKEVFGGALGLFLADRSLAHRGK